jgi:3-phosphoshikimate 1-carboxyvinyltransferase
MKKVVNSSIIEGVVVAPASKSVMIRAVAASLLAAGVSRITNPTFCSDALAAMDIADRLGADIDRSEGSVTIRGNGDLRQRGIKGKVLDCGESGLCMRMFAPIAGLLEEEITLTATGSLLSRPMGMVGELKGLGVDCATEGGFPPIRVKGKLKAGKAHIGGSESSQFVTGLLMALPLCRGESVIKVSDLKSKPYVELTIDVMKRFGVAILHDGDLTEFHAKGVEHYRAQDITIEGDWSGAAFFLVAGALAGSIKVNGLSAGSRQADKAVIEPLIKAGAHVAVNGDSVSVTKDRLRAFEFDASDCPDLFPALTVLAGGCEGKSVIYGADRLKHKESDRAQALASEFFKLGIRIDVFGDRMEVFGGDYLSGTVDSHNDHRIAMACAVAALKGKGEVTIVNPECVSKSYPSFFDDLDSVRVKR